MTDSVQFSQTLRQWVDIFMHRSMHDWARYVKAGGYSMPQFFLLMHLHRHEQCGISDLSERMDITSAAVSQLVDKLVQAGLLERAEDPHDRRARQVKLSLMGRAFIAQGNEKRYGWVDGMAEKLSAEEQAQITDALHLMLRAAQDLETDPV
ncbi:MAG: MarR family transcriptional regulator [Chloroflexota bacterium]